MGLIKKVEAVAGIALGGLALVGVGVTITSLIHKNGVHQVDTIAGRSATAPAFDVPAWDYPASSKAATSSAHPREIPVLAYHQLDNGCAATALMCGRTGAGVEILSERQFYDQMSYLHSQGYSTITDTQYVRWATHQPVALRVQHGVDGRHRLRGRRAGRRAALRRLGCLVDTATGPRPGHLGNRVPRRGAGPPSLRPGVPGLLPLPARG